MFEWKEFLKRFHYAQYDDRKLIRDLQLQVEDMNTNFKLIADYFGISDDRLLDLETALGPHDHDDRYYTEAEADSLLAGKSDITHNHDGRYYTEAEVDSLLSTKTNLTQAREILRAVAIGGSLDWNHATNIGLGVGPVLLPGNAANGPGSAAYFYSYCIGFTGNTNIVQYAVPDGATAANKATWYRMRVASVWTAWVRLIDGNKPRFAAYGAGTGDVAVETRWTPNVVSVNVGGGYAPGTGLFTCPVAGEYRIEAKYLGGNVSTARQDFSILYRNRAGVSTPVSHSHSSYQGFSMGKHLFQGDCLAGDSFSINVQAGGYSMYAALGTYNWFWGELVA